MGGGLGSEECHRYLNRAPSPTHPRTPPPCLSDPVPHAPRPRAPAARESLASATLPPPSPLPTTLRAQPSSLHVASPLFWRPPPLAAPVLTSLGPKAVQPVPVGGPLHSFKAYNV